MFKTGHALPLAGARLLRPRKSRSVSAEQPRNIIGSRPRQQAFREPDLAKHRAHPRAVHAPWENGHIESFHDKLRDECLNREIFGSLLEAKIIVESWRVEYNTERPHSSLGNKTPEEFAGRGAEC